MPPTYANGHISATGDPIHFMFGSRVGFSGTIERRYLRFEQIQDGGHRHVGKISSGDISATGRPIHFIFCSRAGFSGPADLMALFLVRLPPSWKNCKWPLAISPQPVVRCTSCLVIGWGFTRTADLMALFSIRTNSRWRRKWRPPPSWLISNGHISATAHDLLI